ncbi:replication factor C subunit 1 [Thamnophis elegans]|uniref:replication factor C subunit 1 n=1 Tax=Thamnophis elegans TaxID=35005 RepID=UPI0013786DDD|nr:replication factor C subunit 1 [Thamnophis elegans]
MDIRKFFGVVTPGKKPECGIARKEKPQNKERNSGGTSTLKEIKVKSLPREEDFKQKKANKKKRIIYDSDSEEEVPSIKKSKPPERKLSPNPAKLLKADPVVYVSETDEDEDFVSKKPPPKVQQFEKPVKATQGTTGASQPDSKPKVKNKPLSPVKLTPTSVIDYFGTVSVQRSEKKLVSSKRKEPSKDPTINDEAIAKELQLEENSKRERQLHEDEEFAQTLAMLDETPRKKKPRKEEFQQSKSGEAEKTKQAHKGKPTASALDSQPYSAKDQLHSESVRVSSLHPESSATKEEVDWGNKRGSSKASSRLTPPKQKAEAVKIENGASRGENLRKGTVTPAGKNISPKTKTPTKVSPEQSKSVSPEDSAEKKRTNYTAYRSFLNREGPKALGSKEIPQGGENCLEGMTFVITGIFESIERDEAKSLIERYGGKVTGNISKKTNYLVKGRDCGMSKCEKASALGTKVIDEDGLFDLIRNTPGRKSKYEIAAETEAKRTKSKVEKTSPVTQTHKRKPSPAKLNSDSRKKTFLAENTEPFKSVKQEAGAVRRGLDFLEDEEEEEEKQVPKEKQSSARETNKNGGEVLLWVDKYKPTSLKSIIGQQGEQSCANKLLRWLKNWQKNSLEDKQVKSSKFGSKDDGANSKAALLSGPPGIGKTTTASLVCQELGLSYVELNASDTRSKNSLKEVVAESLNNTSIKGFCSGASRSVSAKHVLLMDEVDGMAGNEDRGGIQELIDLIKHTKIPIICMCNDRNHPKIRSLVHYCFDLRVPRPRVEQIKGAMMSIAFKEGLKVPPPAMNELILAANQDIRQVLHNLSMWCARDKTLTYDGVKEDASKAKKDIKLGPFDVVRKVFAKGEETSHLSLIDKADLFFHDYSLGPLFVQENYIHVKPAAAGNNLKKELILLSKTADSICDGDLVDRQIRTRQNWSLLPTQAIYSSVLPGELMRGYLQEFPSFPSWLGKFSSTGKHDRIIQELSMHMSLRTHASKRAVNLDYLSYLRDAVVRPLACQGSEGVRDAVTFMDSYCLLKEDVENLMEVTSWAGKPSAFSKLDSKVKSAFTRAYNKVSHLTPYSLQTAPKPKHAGSLDVEMSEELESNEVESEQGSLESDAMIKKKTKPAKPPKAERKEEKKKGKSKKKS